MKRKQSDIDLIVNSSSLNFINNVILKDKVNVAFVTVFISLLILFMKSPGVRVLCKLPSMWGKTSPFCVMKNVTFLLVLYTVVTT